MTGPLRTKCVGLRTGYPVLIPNQKAKGDKMYSKIETDNMYSVRCAGCDLLYKYTRTEAEATHLAAWLDCPYCEWNDPF